jgi:hypothetical protein
MAVTSSFAFGGRSLRPAAGIGLRAQHVRQILEEKPQIGWFEVHSENFFSLGGVPAHYLERIRADYPLSLHGVGLSLGSTDPLDADHLRKLRRLIDRYQPALVSDHLCWSSVGGRHLNDLLPLPYTQEALQVVAANIVQAQDALGRQILVENVSSYLRFRDSGIPEWEFLAEIASLSGCAILLDVNNVYVSARNHGFSAHEYLRRMPAAKVQEIHLAGHTSHRFDGREVLVDTHNQRVCAEVWALYRYAIAHYGNRPTLIEWDSDLPALEVLIDEMNTANDCMESFYVRAA